MVDARARDGHRVVRAANVCASRKSSRCSRSATTIAYRPSGVKYMLYGSSTGIGLPGLAGARIDRRQAVADVVRHVERLQVPGRHDVLRQRADREVVDDPVRARIDLVDGVAAGCSARRRARARCVPPGRAGSRRRGRRRLPCRSNVWRRRRSMPVRPARAAETVATVAGGGLPADDDDARAERRRRPGRSGRSAGAPPSRTCLRATSTATIAVVGVPIVAPRPPIT